MRAVTALAVVMVDCCYLHEKVWIAGGIAEANVHRTGSVLEHPHLFLSLAKCRWVTNHTPKRTHIKLHCARQCRMVWQCGG